MVGSAGVALHDNMGRRLVQALRLIFVGKARRYNLRFLQPRVPYLSPTRGRARR